MTSTHAISNHCHAVLGIAAALCIAGNTHAVAADPPKGEHPPGPPILFSAPLADVPGKQLVVVGLEFALKPEFKTPPHRHPGSVYVYVTKGAVRLGLEGQPVKTVHAGESFFEPSGALHEVAEDASDTEPAAAIAVMIVPDGAPLLSVAPPKH